MNGSKSAASGFKSSDEFTSGVNGFFDVIAARWPLFAIGAALILVAGVVAAVVSSKNEQHADAGRSSLYIAQKSLDTQLKALALASAPAPAAPTKAKGKTDSAAPSAVPGIDAVMFQPFDVDARLADPVAKLKTTATDFATTRSGEEAMLMLGKLYLDHGQPAKATGWFEKFSARAKTLLDRASASENLGISYEMQGKFPDALEAFDKGLGAGDSALRGDLLLDKARVFEEMKNPEQAKAVYDQILTQFSGAPDGAETSEYAKTAQILKARL